MPLLKLNSTLAAAAALALLTATPVKAVGISLSIQSVSYAAGTNNDFLEVSLTNNTGSVLDIDSFEFNISTTDTSISFIDATDATTPNPYIFPTTGSPESEDIFLFASGGDLLPNGADSNSGQNFTGNIPDDANINTTTFASVDASIAAGATVALGEVFFDIAPGAALGPNTISFITTDDDTSIYGTASTSPISFTAGTGAITVTAAVPEPSLAWPLAFALLLGAGPKLRDTKQRRASYWRRTGLSR